jgi:hypothetical protein
VIITANVLSNVSLLLLLLLPAGEEGLTVTACEDWSDNIRWVLMPAYDLLDVCHTTTPAFR